MDKNITIRRYQEGDENQIADLLHASFPNAIDSGSIRKTWLWQFKNLFAATPSVMVGDDNGEIVAQYAVMKFPMMYQGESTNGAVSSATATDMRYRGRGLFTLLAERLCEDLSRDGCEIILGFPNTQSIHGFTTRLGWFELCPFPLHVKIIDLHPIVKRYLGDNFTSRLIARIYTVGSKLVFRAGPHAKDKYTINVICADALPDGINEVWRESFSSRNISVVKDKQYLYWRYFQKPFFEYEFYTVLDPHGELCGYFVIYFTKKFGLKTIYLMECAASRDSRDIYCSILDKVDEIALQKQADAISILLMPNHPGYDLFRKRGFLRIPKKLFPQSIYFGVKILSERIDPVYTKEARNWYISWGDLDVV